MLVLEWIREACNGGSKVELPTMVTRMGEASEGREA